MAKTRKTEKVLLPTTKEEAIAKALTQMTYGHFQPEKFELPTRSFEIGQEVEYGNHDDVKVEAILDEGRIYILSHPPFSMRAPDFNNRCYVAQPWFFVYPLNDSKVKTVARRDGRTSWIVTHLLSLITRATCNDLRDNQDYQRGYVWTEENKIRFIESAFDGLDLGKFVLLKFKWPDNKYEVLDGKQRLSALRDYVWGRFAVRGKLFHELTRMDRYELESRMVQFVELDGESFSKVARLRLFLELNVAGVPQTEEHLNHVRELLAAELAKTS